MKRRAGSPRLTPRSRGNAFAQSDAARGVDALGELLQRLLFGALRSSLVEHARDRRRLVVEPVSGEFGCEVSMMSRMIGVSGCRTLSKRRANRSVMRTKSVRLTACSAIETTRIERRDTPTRLQDVVTRAVCSRRPTRVEAITVKRLESDAPICCRPRRRQRNGATRRVGVRSSASLNIAGSRRWRCSSL